MRYQILQKLYGGSLDQIRPHSDIRDWLYCLDYCDEVEGVRSRHQISCGLYKAKIIGIHKCYEQGFWYYQFVFMLSDSDSRDFYFNYETKAFDETPAYQNKKLIEFISVVLATEADPHINESNLTKLLGKTCLVDIQEYGDIDEKFICECRPFIQIKK